MLIEAIFAFTIGLIMLAALLTPLSDILRAVDKIELNKESTLVQSCSEIKRLNGKLLEKCEKSDLRLKQQSGISVLEIILSCLLFSVITAASLKALGLLSFQTKAIDTKLSEISVALRLSTEIERIYRFSEQHPLALLPKIHNSGQINLANGLPNQVLSGNIKFRPAVNSSALSNIDPDISTTLDIQNCTVNSGHYQGLACLRTANSLEQYRSYLLYSLDGYQEATGILTGSGKCRNFSLLSADGMYFKAVKNITRCNIITIIPVRTIQTIYFSAEGDLRLITHKADQNLENQPLTNTLTGFNLQITHLDDLIKWQLTRQAKKISSKTLFKAFISDSELDFFLNKV